MSEMFLKLAGIEGESVDAKHKGEIDVLAWSWGLSEVQSPAGGGAGAGRPKIENISIQKLVDLASPLLLSFSAQGKHISDGTLTTRKAGKLSGDSLPFKMTDVIRPTCRLHKTPISLVRISPSVSGRWISIIGRPSRTAPWVLNYLSSGTFPRSSPDRCS